MIAMVDTAGELAAFGTLTATCFGGIVAFIKARQQTESLDVRTTIEVNEDLRRELKRRKSETHDLRNENQELHIEIEKQRGEIVTLQERVSSLRRQVEQLDEDLQRALKLSPG
jgi:predicted RNase H-like nuclease (RuvC/YqgF family)